MGFVPGGPGDSYLPVAEIFFDQQATLMVWVRAMKHLAKLRWNPGPDIWEFRETEG